MAAKNLERRLCITLWCDGGTSTGPGSWHHNTWGYDRLFTIDDLDRVQDEERGVLSGGTITTTKSQEIYTLDHLGNWEESKRDLNGDADFVDALEFDDDFTATMANAVKTRVTSGGTETLAYDASGHMTDDGADYAYTYDAFGRLVLVEMRGTSNERGNTLDLHSLRATLATWLAQAGVSSVKAARLIRHADPRTTQRH